MERLPQELADKLGCHPDDNELLTKLIKYYPVYSTISIDKACEDGDVEMFKFLQTLGRKCTRDSMGIAISNGHIEIVKTLYEMGEKCYANYMHTASENGYLEIIKYFNDNGGYHCGREEMYMASLHGHLEVVKYFHSIGIKPYELESTYDFRNYPEVREFLESIQE